MNDLIGKIFKSERQGKVRVISADEIEVFYEPWHSHSNSWYFTNSRTVNFFRLHTQIFLKTYNLKWDHHEPQLQNVDRLFPQLPLRLMRFSNHFWASHIFNSIVSFRNYCKIQNIQTDGQPIINAAEIYLNPMSSLGRVYNGPLIKAESKDGFSPEEILFHAFKIQSNYIKKDQIYIQYERYGPIYSGMGIYRLGLRSSRPSYYIGAYHDLDNYAGMGEREDNKL